jgi:hypothetical protein
MGQAGINARHQCGCGISIILTEIAMGCRWLISLVIKDYLFGVVTETRAVMCV